MARLLTRPDVVHTRCAGARSAPAGLVIVTVAVIVPLGTLTWFLPGPLVLPLLSLILIALSGVGVLVASSIRSDRAARRFSAWDSAGVLFLAGCCAAMLSEPAAFVAFLEDAQLAHQADPLPRDPPN